MSRSTGLSTGRMMGSISRIIRTRSRIVTVQRPTTTTGSLDQKQETTDDHIVEMWLYEPDKRTANEIAGERVEGDLGGLAVADGTFDMERDDRVVHGGITYEVDTVVGHPNDADADGTPTPDTDFWMVDMVRRQ